MQENRPPEQFAGYQPANGPESSPYDTQAYQPINNYDGPSYSQHVYHPLDSGQVPSNSQQALFSAPLPHNDVRFVAVLTYSLFWFSGLLFTLFTRENRYVRFHALQSLIFFGAINVLDIAVLFVIALIHHIVPFVAVMLLLGFLLFNVIAFVGWLVAVVQAYRGTYYRLPLVGDIVARALNVQPPLK